MTKKPEYMFPELQGLPEEFRRLAVEAEKRGDKVYELDEGGYCQGSKEAFEQAAQMLEERLNGND